MPHHPPPQAHPERWIIDTDPAIGLRFRDIDDALAVHAMVRGGVPVDALTTTFGNAPLARVQPIAEDLGRRYGVEVFRGAAGPGDRATPAVDRLVAHRGGVLAIGPCTNVAAALDRGARWSSLVILGGTERRSANLRYVHLTELNFALDVVAARRALRACTALFAMEVCRKLVFREADLAPLAPDLQARCASWLRIAPRLTGTDGFHPWDLLPALHIVDPTLFRLEPRQVRLEPRWPRRGMLTLTGTGLSGDPAENDAPVALATDFSPASVIRRWRSLV